MVCKAGLTGSHPSDLQAEVQTLEANSVPTGKYFNQSTKASAKSAQVLLFIQKTKRASQRPCPHWDQDWASNKRVDVDKTTGKHLYIWSFCSVLIHTGMLFNNVFN